MQPGFDNQDDNDDNNDDNDNDNKDDNRREGLLTARLSEEAEIGCNQLNINGIG